MAHFGLRLGCWQRDCSATNGGPPELNNSNKGTGSSIRVDARWPPLSLAAPAPPSAGRRAASPGQPERRSGGEPAGSSAAAAESALPPRHPQGLQSRLDGLRLCNLEVINITVIPCEERLFICSALPRHFSSPVPSVAVDNLCKKTHSFADAVFHASASPDVFSALIININFWQIFYSKTTPHSIKHFSYHSVHKVTL